MKPVYRCEYCDHMGTEDEVKEHEIKCYWNYDRKSCWTCKNRDRSCMTRFKCLLETEILEGHLIEFCSKYARDDNEVHFKSASDIFRGLFGGL